MPSTRRQLREIYAALDAAETYGEWLAAASAHDALSGADAWRARDESPHYDAASLRAALARMDSLRAAGDGLGLAAALAEDLQRHLDDLSAPDLYDTAMAGPKHLVTQKPRLLTHLTAPDVLVASAALASSALPGLFPPVVLQARPPGAAAAPWIPEERWVDGSLYGDLPKQRLARLHNVNHFIVSQTNPHVLPFVQHHGRRGLTPALAGLAGATARTQLAYGADLARRATRRASGPLGQIAEQAYALVSQDYRGDIDIHPRLRLSLARKVVSNPSRQDLTDFIREGERAVWPQLAIIRDQTRIGRAFRACVAALQ